MLRKLTFLFGFVVLAAAALPACAHSRSPYSMEVLVDGVPLQAHHGRGKTYVEALEGREYSIRVTNGTGERVAVALAVDGLNSIDAKTTGAREASKWILGPWETAVIDGWQTGPSTARRFFFTTETQSYGAWLGQTQNLGVVSAAFFREKAPRPVPYVHGERQKSAPSTQGSAVPAPEGGRRRDADSGTLGAPGESKRQESESLSDDHAATGIGRELDHRVRRVHFDAEIRPASVVELRYEYRDTLIGLGILPRTISPLERRESAHGFDDFDFAPVPR